MTIVYLCGPINGCTDAEAKDWRNFVKTRIRDTLDPMRRDYRGKEAESYREIVELDKIDVERCGAVLVNYDKPSVGTSMEIYHAWLRHIPVVVVCRPETVISPWLRYHATKFCHSFDDAIRWIEAL